MLFGCPYKDYRILGSIVGSPYIEKLPSRLLRSNSRSPRVSGLAWSGAREDGGTAGSQGALATEARVLLTELEAHPHKLTEMPFQISR